MLLYDLVQVCMKLELKMIIDIKDPKRIEKVNMNYIYFDLLVFYLALVHVLNIF